MQGIYLWLIYGVVFVVILLVSNYLVGLGGALFRYYQNRYLQNVSRTLETMFIFLNPKRILNISIVFMCLAFLVTLVASELNIVISLVMGFIGLIVPRILLGYYLKKRKKTFEVQFVNGLDFLSSSMRAGLSLVQAIESLVEHTAPPLSQEFDLLLREYRIGIPLNEALANLSRRSESEEMNLMVFTTIITRELGGDISEIFDHLGEVIRARHRVIERIDTLTAQGKLQAIVCGAIPFILYGVLMAMSPEFLEPMYETTLGKIGLWVMIVIQICVFLIVRRMVQIRI